MIQAIIDNLNLYIETADSEVLNFYQWVLKRLKKVQKGEMTRAEFKKQWNNVSEMLSAKLCDKKVSCFNRVGIANIILLVKEI